jgi:Rrf2 family protein
MLSKKTEYALKALIKPARQSVNEPVLLSELARREEIPRKFLEAILLTLNNAGLLQSKIGKGGGFFFPGDRETSASAALSKCWRGLCAGAMP